MQVPSGIKRAIVRQAYADAVSESTTLLAQLEADLATASAAIVKGKVLVAAEARNTRTRYQILAGYSPEDALATVEELITLSEDATTHLQGAGYDPTDLELRDEMLYRLQRVTSFQKTYVGLRNLTSSTTA